jgi:RNA-directed DNA polymerase
VNVGEMQRKLSQWAERDKNHRFFDLHHLLYDKDWLRLAHDHVKENAGSMTAGCDGVNMSVFDEQLDENLVKLAEDIKTGSFIPQPVRRVYLRKPNGKLRPLGIPAIRDRIVQEAMRMILEPIYEADFSQFSFGFRPNRRTMDAVKYLAGNTIGVKKYYWVIEGDISSYFDTLCQRKLLKLLRRRLKDEKILWLISKFLHAGVMEGKLFKATNSGVPQGGILSPLLSNVYLHELDKHMEKYTALSYPERARRRKQGKGNFVYARYADDFVALCNGTRADAEALKQELATLLRAELKLTLSEEKTKVTHLNDGFEFLGFRIQRCRSAQGMKTKILIPESAKAKLLLKLKHCTDASQHQDSVKTKIQALNRIVSGWCQYYQYTSQAATDFNYAQYRLFWLTGHWLGRKFKISFREVCVRFKRDTTFAADGCSLIKADIKFPTRRYKASAFKPNPYTHQEIALSREELLEESYWPGFERRPGMADLRPEILRRDQHRCQMCNQPVSVVTAEIDHIKPVRRFKRPVDANTESNLWTLCHNCHQWKTEYDRRMESPLPGKLARRVRRGE